jgi:hypothetical protein
MRFNFLSKIIVIRSKDRGLMGPRGKKGATKHKLLNFMWKINIFFSKVVFSVPSNNHFQNFEEKSMTESFSNFLSSPVNTLGQTTSSVWRTPLSE